MTPKMIWDEAYMEGYCLGQGMFTVDLTSHRDESWEQSRAKQSSPWRTDDSEYRELYEIMLSIARQCAGVHQTPIIGWDAYCREELERNKRKAGIPK